MLYTIIDIVVFALIVLITIRGFIRGFIKSFLSTFGTILSLLFAVLLASSTTNFLENNFGLVTAISGGLSDVLTKVFGDSIMNTTLAQATEGALNEAGLAGWIVQIILSVQADGSIPTDVTLNQIICPVFGYYVSLAISAIILFILFKIIFFIVGEIVSKNKKLPLLRGVDKVLGLVFGLFQGVIIIEFILLIMGAIPLAFFQNVIANIDQAPLTNFIHTINLFSIIINKISLPNVSEFITSIIGNKVTV
jgi:uncharacterized membrane protein required for colicin V production